MMFLKDATKTQNTERYHALSFFLSGSCRSDSIYVAAVQEASRKLTKVYETRDGSDSIH